MKKKLLGLIYLFLFFGMMLSGVLTMPFIEQDGSAEKRILAQRPSLYKADGSVNWVDFPSQFEEWLDDHIGLRMIWMQQYAALHSALKTSVNEQVIVGQDGWLFYEPTIADYTGVDSLTENERYRVKYLLEALSRAIDAPLVVFFAPNKNTLYPEYMPSGYPLSGDEHAMQWLIDNADVNIIDSVSILSQEGLYHLTDTHWNQKGARIGASAIIERVNSLTGSEGAQPDPYSAYSLTAYTGDLGQMLFAGDPPADWQMVYEDQVQNYRYVGRYRTPEDMTITTEGSGAPLKLLVLRDSFSNLLVESLSNAYSNVQYRRAMPLPLWDAQEYDAVVLEMVERRIGELLEDAPCIQALEVQPWAEHEVNCTATICAEVQKEGVLLCGELDSSIDCLSEIKVSVSVGDETHVYEAFPVSAAAHFDGDGCFALYLSELAPDAQIQVYMAGDGVLVSQPCAAVFAESM